MATSVSTVSQLRVRVRVRKARANLSDQSDPGVMQMSDGEHKNPTTGPEYRIRELNRIYFSLAIYFSLVVSLVRRRLFPTTVLFTPMASSYSPSSSIHL